MSRMDRNRARRARSQDDAFYDLLAVKADSAEREWSAPSAIMVSASDARIVNAKAALCTAQIAVIHTDGGCEPNPGVGGWGVTIAAGGREPICLWGGVPDTTNNRMEMTAAIVALSVLPPSCAVTIFGDSQYLIKGMTAWLAGWKRKGFRRGDGLIPNADLWRVLDALSSSRSIRWEWVRGHNGHAGNELADGLATRGMREITKACGPSEGPSRTARSR